MLNDKNLDCYGFNLYNLQPAYVGEPRRKGPPQHQSEKVNAGGIVAEQIVPVQQTTLMTSPPMYEGICTLARLTHLANAEHAYYSARFSSTFIL